MPVSTNDFIAETYGNAFIFNLFVDVLPLRETTMSCFKALTSRKVVVEQFIPQERH